jgi:hypothetical protein
MSDDIVIVALVLSGASFLLYLAISIAGARAKPADDAHTVAGAALQKLQTASADEITALINALTAFSDSLAKAGPAVTSIIASILFLAVAVIVNVAPIGNHATTPAQQQGSIKHN